MTDKVFGELKYDLGFIGEVSINFFGEESDVKIVIMADEENEGIADIQYETYEMFKKNWTDIQNDIVDSIIAYYNDEEKGSYGPDDKEEFKEWWPNIESKEDLLPLIHIDTIVIPDSYLMGDGRTIYVLFNRDWGGEDYDDNGVAVRLVDENVGDVGYKDMAY